MNSRRKHRSLRALLLAVAVLACTGLDGRAQNSKDDEEEVAPDVKFFQGILHGLGLRKDGANIDYRERSPLVVPPSRDLPSPETTTITEKNPAWPTDPDVKRAKEAKAARKKPRRDIEEDSRPMTPEQLRNPAAEARRTAGQPGTPSTNDPTDKSTMGELGSKSIFSFTNLWGQKEEYGTFTREPPRSALTEPPPGYRTPSPNQPYGVGKEKYVPAAQSPLDNENLRGLGR
jgi:hypothetical protein